jgi:hypothetical protein
MEGSGGIPRRKRWQKGDSSRGEEIEGIVLELPN